MHVNKALYTFSYMCVTAGAAGIVFTGIYMLVGILSSSTEEKISMIIMFIFLITGMYVRFLARFLVHFVFFLLSFHNGTSKVCYWLIRVN